MLECCNPSVYGEKMRDSEPKVLDPVHQCIPAMIAGIKLKTDFSKYGQIKIIYKEVSSEVEDKDFKLTVQPQMKANN